MKIFNSFFAIILYISCVPANAQTAQPYDVFGRVIDSRTRKSVEGASIQYVLDNRIINAKKESEADGTFELDGYPVSKTDNAVELIIRKKNYAPKFILTKITDKTIPDIELESYAKKIKGIVRNYRTGELMQYIDIEFNPTDYTGDADSTVTDDDGSYYINTIRNSGDKLDIRVSSNWYGFKNLEHTLIIPEKGNFKEIYILFPKKNKGLKIGLSVGSALFLGGGIAAKLISDEKYEDYQLDKSASRQDLFDQAQFWNRASIVSTSLGAGCAVTLGFVIGNKKGSKVAPKIF